jgi:hypothetical protein
MTRYRNVYYGQDKFIPVSVRDQSFPDTFEYILSPLIGHEQDPNVFDERYRNDETGAPYGN